MIFLYVTCRDEREAQSIGRELLRKKLAGCANIFPLQSMYLDKGAMRESQEYVLLIKTSLEKRHEASAAIKELHSYDVPCIATIPIEHINEEYAQWMKGEMN